MKNKTVRKRIKKTPWKTKGEENREKKKRTKRKNSKSVVVL